MARIAPSKTLSAAYAYTLGAVLCLATALVLLWLRSPPTPPWPAPAMDTVEVRLRGQPYLVEVARTPAQRARGLMGRTALPADRGMLFPGTAPAKLSFWMKDTLIPLDILFFDQHWRVVEIRHDVPPCKANPCPLYGPAQPVWHVLELAAGQAARLGVEEGDTLVVPPLAGKP